MVSPSEKQSLLKVMRRPKWIGFLLLALAVSAAFAGLGRWQLERAVIVPEESTSETVVDLQSITEPQTSMLEAQAGQKVSVSAAFVPGDFAILADRFDQGTEGYWLIGRATVDSETSKGDAVLAVALGWTADRAAAEDALVKLQGGTWPDWMATDDPVTGRYSVPEQAKPPKAGTSAQELTFMSPAALINTWADYDGEPVYGGYLVADQAPDGLSPIDSPEPIPAETVNWLNLFYAAEWVVFAGFSIYLWYRLAKDERDREVEQAELDAEEAAKAAEESATPAATAETPASG